MARVSSILTRMVGEPKSAPWLARRLQGVTVLCVFMGAVHCFAQEAVVAPPSPPAPTSEHNERLAQARDAFALGSALARQGQWVEALVAFDRSFRLHAHPTTLFNIGFCERALGRITRARKSFRAALEGTAGQPPLAAELAAEAESYLAEIEQRIVRATVVVRQPSLRLTINGRPLEAEKEQAQGRTLFVAGTRDAGPPEAPPITTFSLLLDPGEQSFVISNDGIDHVVTRQFAPGSSPRIELSAPSAVHPGRESARPISQVALPAIAYGVGAAGIVVGTVFGIATLHNAKSLKDECPSKDRCPATAQADVDASKRNSIISDVGFAVGLAGGVVGTVLLLTQPKHGIDPRSDSKFVRANVGLGRVNIEGSF